MLSRRYKIKRILSKSRPTTTLRALATAKGVQLTVRDATSEPARIMLSLTVADARDLANLILANTPS